MTEPSPELWFHRTATLYVAAQALYHLNECGVIASLAEAPATAAELSRRLTLDERLLSGLLSYLARVDPIIGRGADGRYEITAFGRRALERYSHREDGRTSYNLFDVRVGGYGPVWAALGDLLRGRAVYGREISRAGGGAARGLRRSAGGLLPALRRAADAAGAAAVVEVGVDAGLLARLAAERPGLDATGVDLSDEELAAAREAAGPVPARWIRGDFFAPAEWAAQAGPGRLLVFTLHLHELAARGAARVRDALAALGRARPGTVFAAFEQPLLPDAARAELPEAEWLYAQSNVLIHELVGKGRVLSESEWSALLTEAGGRDVRVEPTGYLGYTTFTATLG
jgi:hypothetical protein